MLVMTPYLEVPCDCIVIRGTLAVDEGFVTGESMPVVKKEGADMIGGTIVFQALAEGADAIVCTELAEYIETGTYAIVQATKTAYMSAKGKAFKNLTEGKTVKPPVYYDTVKMITVMVGVSAVPLTWSFMYLYMHGLSLTSCMYYVLDLLYSVISPALPTTIWVGMSIWAKRLQAQGIACKNLSVTNISGNIETVCFDKTGTLTEEGLDVKCVYTEKAEHYAIDEMHENVVRGLRLCHSVEYINNKMLGDPLDVKMVQFAHGEIQYAIVDTERKKIVVRAYKEECAETEIAIDIAQNNTDDIANEIEEIDNVEIYDDIVQSTDGCTSRHSTEIDIVNNKQDACDTVQNNDTAVLHTEYGPSIVHRVFDFDANTRNMGVIAETDSKLVYYCKGSPEVIEQLCIHHTLPKQYKEIVQRYAMEGYRVIAMAQKECVTVTDTKEMLDSALSFLCIIVFENKLKKETKKTVTVLRNAGIKNIMCTGDALLTAVSVATHCGIVEKHYPVLYPVIGQERIVDALEWICINNADVVFDKILLKTHKDNDYTSYADFVLAIEGDTYEMLAQVADYKELVKKRCRVYARMNPAQKGAVVKMYKETELVCFIGDGANDCNAIQNADVGVSLLCADGTAEEF